jgi:hypothetical protein
VSIEPWDSAFTVSPVDWQPVAFALLSRGYWMVGCGESGAPATLELSWATENSRFLSSSFPCSTARCGNLNLRLFYGLFVCGLRSRLLRRSDGIINIVKYRSQKPKRRHVPHLSRIRYSAINYSCLPNHHTRSTTQAARWIRLSTKHLIGNKTSCLYALHNAIPYQQRTHTYK